MNVLDLPWGLELSGILYAVVICGTIALILLENRNPLKALSWVIVLMLVPVVGLLMYLIFGKDTRRIRLFSRTFYRRIMEDSTPGVPFSQSTQYLKAQEQHYGRLIELIQRQTDAQLLPADDLAIFTDGDQKVEQLIADIRAARHHVHVEYYIFRSDSTGRRVADALMAKAAEGVEVRLLYDYVGSAWGSKSFYRDLKAAGVHLYPFLPVAFPLLTSKENYRNHRKIVVIDGCIGYVGGMNISDNYTVGTRIGRWRDTHFRLTGVAVNGLQAAFMTDWYVASKIILPSSYFYGYGSLPMTSPSALRAPIAVQTLTSGPTSHFRVLQQALSQVIYGAKKSVMIQSPYFLPTDSLNKAIIGAALSGVRVELLVPYQSDSRATNLAAMSYYDELMRAGVLVYRYRGGFLHSKLVTIDSELSIIGSANMDFRSMEYNFEISTIVYDQHFTEQLEQVMRHDIDSHGEMIMRRLWKKRPLYLKLAESLMRLFAPLM